MASTSTPYGVRAISSQDGVTPRPWRIPFGIASGLGSNIFKGQVVNMTSAGVITPVTATTDRMLAVFDGVDYTPTGGRPAVSPFWASGMTYNANEDMLVYLYPMWLPGTRFQIQADGSVGQTSLGGGFNLSNFAAGNTSTGLSACTVNATQVAGGSQAQFAFTEFATNIDSAIGDAFTDMIFTVAFPQIGFGPQNAIA